MIALIRIRTASAINAKYRGADKKEWDKKLLKSYRNFLLDPNDKVVFKTSYWKVSKTQLKKETSGKCAYCEASTDVVAHGDVEHYRPKSIYWWLAYTYDNYLYVCQICNQTYKSDNFPYSSTFFPAPLLTPLTTDSEIDSMCGKISPDPIDINIDFKLSQYKINHLAEGVHLINPYFDNPEIYFKYEADDVLQEVKIIPTSTIYDEIVKASEDYYGLNRPELKRLRYTVFSSFRVFKKAYGEVSNPATKLEVQKQIDSMLSDRYVFAGMNRFFNTIF